MDLSNVVSMSVPNSNGVMTEVLGIIAPEGAIWRKLSYFSAVVTSRYPGEMIIAGDYVIAFDCIGNGTIYMDGVEVASVATEESRRFIILDDTTSGAPTDHIITFEGSFSLINLSDTGSSATSGYDSYAGYWKEVLSWDSNIDCIYERMFVGTSSGDLKEVTIPFWITKISRDAFNAAQIEEIRVPKNIDYIGNEAFGDSVTHANSKLKTLYFEQPFGMQISLPPPGGYSGMAYSKNARELTVYTDNEYIKNYDWVTDNTTVTFYHLDGTPYEEPPINNDSEYAQYMDFTATEPFIVFTFEGQPIKIVSLDEYGNEVDPVHIDPNTDVTLEIIPTRSVVNDNPNMRVYTIENGTFAVLADSVVDNDGRLEEKLSEYGWSQGETEYIPTVIAPYLGYVAANPRGPDTENPDAYNRIVCWDNITDSDDAMEESEYWVQI